MASEAARAGLTPLSGAARIAARTEGGSLIHLRITGKSDVGRKRKRNEDSLFVSEENALAIVADGMGGLSCGDRASKMAIESLSHEILFSSPTELLEAGEIDMLAAVGRFAQLLGDWLRKANAQLFMEAERTPDHRRMGSTIAIFYAKGPYAVMANVGDARVYRIRGEKISQMSEDHSWVAEIAKKQGVKLNAELIARCKNIVTRALGVSADVQPDVQAQRLAVGDTYLLCTDGLWNMVSGNEIENIVLNHEDRLDQAVEYLIKMANLRGAPDNVTVAIAQVHQGE